jgi:hypothetical protein
MIISLMALTIFHYYFWTHFEPFLQMTHFTP